MTNNLSITTSPQATDVNTLATHYIKSGWFKDTTDVSKAVVKIMTGAELGIGPTASMVGINIIEGKPALSANLIASQIKSSGKYNYKVLTRTNSLCEIEFFERWSDKFESMGKSSFSIEEAKTAELTTKSVWKKYAADMLFARAISRGGRTYCPDIFNGQTVYVPEELETIDSDDVKPIDNRLEPISEKQKDLIVDMVEELARKTNMFIDDYYDGVKTAYGKDLNNLTKAEASDMIKRLKVKQEALPKSEYKSGATGAFSGAGEEIINRLNAQKEAK